LLLGLACGDDDGHHDHDHDGGTAPDSGPDDRPDAMPASGTCGMVIDPYTGMLPGAPTLAGVPVVFSNPDGSMLGTEFTDVKGAASRDDCVPGTVMTFFLENEGPYGVVYTYAGANPGDTFYFRGTGSYDEPEWPYANVNVSWSQDVSGLGDVYYTNVDISCWGAGFGGTAPGYFNFVGIPPCLGADGNIDVLAYTHGSGGGVDDVNGYAFAKGVPITTGTSMTPADNAVTLGPWIPGNLDNAAFVTNPPADAEELCFNGGSGVGDAYFGGFGNCNYWGSAPPPPLVSTVFRGLPEGFGETSNLWADAWRYLGGDYYGGHLLAQMGAFARTITGDFSDHVAGLDWVVASDVTSGRPTVHWISNGAQGDVIGIWTPLVPYYYDYPYEYALWWYVITPNVADGSFRLPELPAGLEEIFSDPYYVAIPGEATYFDLGPYSYRELAGTPGFDPWFVVDGYPVQYLLPSPPPGADLRLRGAYWYYDYDDD